jgi:hypothetical protein
MIIIQINNKTLKIILSIDINLQDYKTIFVLIEVL